MKIDLSDGKIHIDISELLDSIDKTKKEEFVDALAVNEEVIESVVLQITDGWTPLNSHGYIGYTSDTPSTAIDKARRTIAKGASEIAKREIEILENAVRAEKERSRELLHEIHELRAQHGTWF